MALYIVTNLNDSGAGSLRQAILDANANAGTDTIQFSSAITGGTTAGVDDGVIVLTSGQLSITDDLIISGDTDADLRADITLSGNDASRVFSVSGGGTDVFLRSLDMTDGYSAGNGGAIYSSANTLTITNSTVRDSNAAFGGGIISTDLYLYNTAVTNNFATSSGAGIAFFTNSSSTFTNLTVSGNGDANAQAGGILFSTNSNHVIQNSTITENTGGSFGGIAAGGGTTLTIANTILSGNSGGSQNDLQLPGTSFHIAQNNLLGTGVTITTDNGGNVTSDTPGLAALADTGGIVPTHLLLSSSLARGAGDAALLPADAGDVDSDVDVGETLPIDANGTARLIGALDIGAVEDNTALVVDTLSDVVDGNYSAGNLSLREAVAQVATGGTITFDAAITGGTTAGVDDGVITLTSGALVIDRDMSFDGDVNGDEKADIILDGNNATGIMRAQTGATQLDVASLVFQNGFGGSAFAGGLDADVTGLQATVTHSSFLNNTGDFGGALQVADGVVANSTFSGNSGDVGGAAWVRNSATFVNTTFDDNTASRSGGAVATGSGADVLFHSSTVSGNTLSPGADFDGSGVSFYGGTTGAFYNSIVSGNTGGTGDVVGIGVTPGTFSAQNSLFGTTTTVNTDLGGNLFSDTPMLGALADNGGAVETRALLDGSIAISAGDAALLPADAADVDGDADTAEALPIDANGNGRILGALDMGAAENNQTLVVDTLVDEDDGDYSTGDLSLREALANVAAGGTITFDAAITGGTTAGVDDGVITLNGSRLIIDRNVTIDGDTNGDEKADITLDGNDASRVISVISSADAGLFSLTLTGGATDRGAAIRGYTGSVVDIVHSTILGNSASVRGGGVYNQGATFNIVNSLITDNGAITDGGALFQSSGTTNIINTTISGNGPFGDHLYLDAGQTNFLNSTVTDSIYADYGQVNGTNSIFTGSFSSYAYGFSDLGGNVRVYGTAAAGLAPLADNGGSILTHALLAGSPAVGNGVAGLLPADTFDLDGDLNTTEALPIDANGAARELGAEGLDSGAAEGIPEPDLIVNAFTVSDLTLFQGQQVTFDWTVENIGLATSGAFDTGVYLSPDATVTTGDVFIGFLNTQNVGAPGTSEMQSAGFAVDGFFLPGTYYLAAIADDLNSVAESNEGNNVATPVMVSIVQGPVTVDDGFATGGFADIATALGSITAGDTVTVISTNYTSNPETVILPVGGLTFDLAAGITPTLTLAPGVSDVLVTGAGDATLIGNDIANTLGGGDGDDTLAGLAGADTLNGGAGRNTADYSASDARVEIDLAFDTASGGHAAGDDLNDIQDVIGSDFNDFVHAGAEANTLDGGGDADNLNGRGGDDLIRGGAGNDLLSGGNDNDTIEGGLDDDQIFGNGGNDVILGDTGLDTIFGGTGADSVSGGGNNDDILGQGGADTLLGDGGADTLRGGSGDDSLLGGDQADLLFGQGNNDTLEGGAGNDTLQGAAGSDVLLGDEGNDVLTGSTGADRLDGGTGNDTMNGGGADGVRDVYVFLVGYEQDRINAFDQAGTDLLELDEDLWAATNPGLSEQQVIDTFGTLSGGGTILTLDFGGGDILEVQNSAGINQATLGADVAFV